VASGAGDPSRIEARRRARHLARESLSAVTGADSRAQAPVTIDDTIPEKAT